MQCKYKASVIAVRYSSMCLAYGVRKSFDIDAMYWTALHKEGDDVLSDKMRKEMERFVDLKMG